MNKLEKYYGIFPAFYACYDELGEISLKRVEEYAKYLISKGVNGIYVGGDAGEYYYQTLEERKAVLESVIKAANKRSVIIANISAPSTKAALELAEHAKACGADAISVIEPMLCAQNQESLTNYWAEIADFVNIDFVFYNNNKDNFIYKKQNFAEARKHSNVIGMHSCSASALDFQLFKDCKKDEYVLFSGADEFFTANRMLYADSVISSACGIMPELFLAANNCIKKSDYLKAAAIQTEINKILLAAKCSNSSLSLYKEILRCQGIDIGFARSPILPITDDDKKLARQITDMISRAIAKTR